VGLTRLLGTLLLTAALTFPPSARADETAPVTLPAMSVEKIVLPNGLTVLLAPDPLASLTGVRIRYAAGTADDPVDELGVADVARFVASEQTVHVPHVRRALAGLGATNVNTSITTDATIFTEAVSIESAKRLARAGDQSRHTWQIFADVVRLVDRELFPAWHPYVNADDQVDPERVREDTVRAFLGTFYVPKTATLTLADNLVERAPRRCLPSTGGCSRRVSSRSRAWLARRRRRRGTSSRADVARFQAPRRRRPL